MLAASSESLTPEQLVNRLGTLSDALQERLQREPIDQFLVSYHGTKFETTTRDDGEVALTLTELGRSTYTSEYATQAEARAEEQQRQEESWTEEDKTRRDLVFSQLCATVQERQQTQDSES